ncbi:MAG TPA: ribonuclease III [Polyangia bacterium]|nr:ribonuclease III [Polyangia bacterium]
MRSDGSKRSTPQGDAPVARYAELQARLGHTFRTIGLCETAMTHTSWLNEAGQPDRSDNERLEFLGDAVLDLVVSDMLMRRFPDRREGDLSRARAALVSESGLARVAVALDLGAFLLLGKGEERTGGRTRPSILANTLEALMGAIYLDAGFDAVAAVAGRLFDGRIADVDAHALADYKSRLQERAQALWQTAPVYEVVAEDGPDHDKRFEVALTLGGRPYGRAIGRSKKEAEQGAAAAALEAIERGEKP